MADLSVRLVALAGVGCISFAAIFVRLAETSPATVTTFRTLYALPVLAVAWLAVRSRDHRPPTSRWLAFGAGSLLAIDLTAWHVSIGDIGAGLATVLANTQVAFVAVAAWLLYRERPSRWAVTLVPVVFLGVVLISGLGRGDAYGDRPWAGVAFGVLAAVFYAAFLLTLRHSNRRHLAPAAGPVLDATMGAAVGGLVLGLVFGDLALAPTWPSHGWLLTLGLVAQAGGWLLITHALPRLAALETSVVILMQPVLTIVWAYLIFEEALSAVQWSGVAFVLSGLLVLNLVGTMHRRSPHLEAVSERTG